MEIWERLVRFLDDYGPPTVCGAVVVGVLALLLYAAHRDNVAWKSFAAEHRCKVVGQIRGSVSTGIGTPYNGNETIGVTPMVLCIPGKTGYLCDDGVTYWR